MKINFILAIIYVLATSFVLGFAAAKINAWLLLLIAPKFLLDIKILNYAQYLDWRKNGRN